MKASELMGLLQKSIDEKGDLDVFFEYEGMNYENLYLADRVYNSSMYIDKEKIENLKENNELEVGFQPNKDNDLIVIKGKFFVHCG